MYIPQNTNENYDYNCPGQPQNNQNQGYQYNPYSNIYNQVSEKKPIGSSYRVNPNEKQSLKNVNYFQNFPASKYPLAELEYASNVLIAQKGNCLRAITCGSINCENLYRVMIGNNENNRKVLFELEEINNCCWHCCFESCWRSFSMDIKKVTEDNGISIMESLAHIERPCLPGIFCCLRPELYIMQENVLIGKIIQPFKCCSPEFEIYDGKGVMKYFIKISCCQCAFFCGKCLEVNGEIYDASTNSVVGYIKKECSCQSIFNKADDYWVVFPKNASVNEKLTLISAVILIDYRLFD